MARSYAQVFTRIWNDEDFKARSPKAQWLYLLLLSQPNLNSAGVLPLQIRRWATLSEPATEETVRAGLEELARTRYVLVDEDTEEVLLRSFIRNDGLWRQPNMLKAALRDVAGTLSPVLRAELRVELERLPILELPGRRAEATGELLGRVTRTLPGTHPVSPIRLTGTLSVGAPDGTNECAPVGLTGTPREPFPEGWGVGAVSSDVLSVGTHLVEQAETAPSEPTPKSKTRRATGPPDHLLITDSMRQWAREHDVTVDLAAETQQFLDHHRAKGSTFKDWTAAWRTWMRRTEKYAPKQPANAGRRFAEQ